MTITHRHRILTVIALAVLFALLASSAAAARTNIAVGLGDQNPAMFSADRYRALKLHKTRFYIRWDAMNHGAEVARGDAFVAAARSAGVRVLMHVSTNDFRIKRAHLPSVSAYRRTVGRLVRHYRAKGVREWGVWNEANHASQPTYRSPRRAAQYFKVMRRLCRGCKIVALDALDQAGVTRYIRRFFRALGSSRRYARVIGIHNYSDTNRRRSRGTRSIIRAVKRYNRRADFWLTETGGVVEFGNSFPCNEQRAASRVRYMFRLARRFRRDITRLYDYNWQGTDCATRFDAGLVRANGSARPGYFAFKRGLGGFKR